MTVEVPVEDDPIDTTSPGIAYLTFRSEHDGICLRCYGTLSEGDLIRYDWGEGPVHPVCIREVQPA